MQIRCLKCSMPIYMGKDTLFAALDVVEDENMTHYDLRCPKCRKMNRVSVEQLKRAAPGWTRDREENLPEAE